MLPKSKSFLEILLPYLRMPAAIFAVGLLQIQWPGFLTFGEIKPNLLLILLFLESPGRTPLYGAFWGLVMGLFLDVFSSGLLGFFALVYSLVGVLGGALGQKFYLRELKIQLGVLISVILAYEAVFFGTYHFLYVAENWYRGLYWVLLPETLYTFLLGSGFLWLKSKLYITLGSSEKKPADEIF